MTIAEIALDIADESECSFVETSCLSTILDGVEWYDTREIRPEIDFELFARAISYLTRRNLLVKHEAYPDLIRIPNASELGQTAMHFLQYQ